MLDFPAMLKIRGRRCVIIGGGAVALRRVISLIECGAKVTVIAPKINTEIQALPVHVELRGYRAGDLFGAFLAVIATDDPAVNAAAGAEAARLGVLVNRADEQEAGDLTVPAHVHIGPLTLCVGSGGISPRAAAVIRDQLAAAMDRDWARLLEIVEPFRAELMHKVSRIDQRRKAMHDLTDPRAMIELKEKGQAAFTEYCRRIVQRAAQDHDPGV